jgi:hypothetical protein
MYLTLQIDSLTILLKRVLLGDDLSLKNHRTMDYIDQIKINGFNAAF